MTGVWCRAAVVGLLALGALGCAAPGPVAGALAGHHPSFVPANGEIIWFLCRWPEGTLRVRVHGAQDARDRETVARALAAWEREGLGLRFDVAADGEAAELEIWIHDAPPAPDAQTGLGSADCDVSGGAASARLVHGQVDVARHTGAAELARDAKQLDPQVRA